MTRVACVQLAPRLGDLDGNAERAQAAVDAAIAGGAEVVVLPELCTSGYMFSGPEEAHESAIEPDHPILAGWAAAAQRSGAVVVGGFAEVGEGGAVFNSAALCAGDRGDAPSTIYRKLHLWDREKLVFDAGRSLPEIVDTPVGRLAMVICYDLEFPELTRALAAAGTQLLAVPTNWPLVSRPSGERPPEAVIAMATARVNRMAVACADRCGTERGQAWTQGTTIIGADGWVAAASGEPGTVIAEIDLALALDKRLTEHAHVFDDRRLDVYPTDGVGLIRR